MNYEKKYKEALERASKLKVQNPFDTVGQMVEHIFPELKESEDKRMLREIKRYIQEQGDKPTGLPNGTVPVSDMITWLEKQGENKPTSKVEPKFKVGDGITDGYIYYKITEILDDRYIIESKYDKRGAILFEYENRYHLWTIQDAKDGNVLAYVTGEEDLWIMIYRSLYEPYEGHVHYHALLVNDNFSDKGTCCICIDNLKPATKEQRELLFQKMKEEGYEWDSEKKELKKIEPKTLDPNKVIEWLNDQGCLGWIEDIEVEKFVEQFKKDFGLTEKGGGE